MSVRTFDFIVGPQTSVAPTVSDPVNDADMINLGWLEEYGFDRGAIHDGVVTVQNCKDIGPTVRQDNQLLLIDALGSIFYFDSSSSATGDDTTVITPTSGSGRWLITSGGGGGGAAQIDAPIAAEDIDVSSDPKHVCLAQKAVVDTGSANLYVDINEGGGEVSTLITETNSLVYDLGVTEDTNDLCQVIEDALNANGSLSFTYTCTYSKTTRLLTLAAGSAFTWMLKTGTHGADNTATYIRVGHSAAADKSASTSYAGDDTVEDWGSWDKKLYYEKTDASYIVKSRNYFGVIESNATKNAQATASKFTEVSGFTNAYGGTKYYTQDSSITIVTGVNDYIDFQEGGGAVACQVAAGVYYKGTNTSMAYLSLRTAIKTALEGVGGYTYEIACKTDGASANKFIVSSVTGVFSLLFNTGTNAATSIRTEIGAGSTDYTASQTYTMGTAVDYTGEADVATGSRIVGDSVYTGFSTDTASRFIEQNYTQSSYDSIYQTPHDFLADAVDIDPGADVAFSDVHIHSSGKGLKIAATIASPSTYKIYFTHNGGATWTLATTTFTYGTPGAYAFTPGTDFAALENGQSYIRVDDQGHGVIALQRQNSGTTSYEAWTMYSTDLDNWSIGNAGVAFSTGGSVLVKGMDVREDRAIIFASNTSNNDDDIFYSTNSGSGFQTWTKINLATAFYETDPGCCYVKYFPLEAGENRYRYVVCGRASAVNRAQIEYCKGDGTGSGVLDPFGTTVNRRLMASGIDKLGKRNTIVFIGYNWAGTSNIFECETNEDYNGGVMTINNHGEQDINSGGSNFDLYNGQSSGDNENMCLNNLYRCIVLGNYCYAFVATAANPAGAIANMMFYSKNLSGGSWESPVNIGDITGNCQEPVAAYISSSNTIVVCHKYNTNTLANNFTNGQIKARLLEINADGTYSAHDIEQIDGGEIMAGKQNLLIVSSSQDGASINWQKYVSGSGYDFLSHNILS